MIAAPWLAWIIPSAYRAPPSWYGLPLAGSWTMFTLIYVTVNFSFFSSKQIG